MTRWWSAARELAATYLDAAREHLDARLERDALATQLEVQHEWYDERGDEVRRLEAAVEHLRGLLAAEETRGAVAHGESERLRAALSTIADRTTDFRAWHEAVRALDPEADGHRVPERFVSREGDATRAELLARLAAAEGIANEAMRVGLRHVEYWREGCELGRGERDRLRAVVDAVLRYERAAVGASGAADALAWHEVTVALRSAGFEALLGERSGA